MARPSAIEKYLGILGSAQVSRSSIDRIDSNLFFVILVSLLFV
jgi:hypothetical protein